MTNKFNRETIQGLTGEVRDLQATVEGLAQENTLLERDSIAALQAIERMEGDLGAHEARYRRAVSMIENGRHSLERERAARTTLFGRYKDLVTRTAAIRSSVVALKDVPLGELDSAIDVLTQAFDRVLVDHQVIFHG